MTALVPSEDRAEICGLPVDDVSMGEAIARICDFVEVGRVSGATHQVVTVNVDFVVTAERDPVLRRILGGADLAVADGMPIVWASRVLQRPLRERVTGADLVPALAGACAGRGFRLGLFGGAPGVAATAADVLRERHDGLEVHGEAGPVLAAPEDMDEAYVERVRAHRPDVLCVALGHPKQEHWIATWRERIGTPVLIGIGGALDMLVGRRRRAPAWMQQSGTEWLFRMAQEPSRLGPRYVKDMVRFPPHVYRDLRRSRVRRQPPLPRHTRS